MCRGQNDVLQLQRRVTLLSLGTPIPWIWKLSFRSKNLWEELMAYFPSIRHRKRNNLGGTRTARWCHKPPWYDSDRTENKSFRQGHTDKQQCDLIIYIKIREGDTQTQRQQGDLITLLIKIRGAIQTNTEGYTNWQQSDLISLLLFFQNKEISNLHTVILLNTQDFSSLTLHTRLMMYFQRP
jgi:hypothetical protein